MAKHSFSTPKQLDNLKPQPKAYEAADSGCPGLRVRIEPTGRKTFRWYYQEAGKRRVKTFGKYGEVTLAQARRDLEKTKENRKDGASITPDASTPKTVEELAERFYKERIATKRKRPEAVQQIIDHDINPTLGKKKLRVVTAPMVGRIVDKAVERGAAVHAGKIMSILKQMFAWAESKGFIERSPATVLKKDNHGVEINMRSRALDTDEQGNALPVLNEIKTLWTVLDTAPRLSPQIRCGIKILLLTGVRSGELRLAQWKEVDLDKATWTVPVENQKLNPKQIQSAKPFIVPLTPMAVELLKELQTYSDDWVMPGAKEKTPITDKAMGRATRRLFDLTGDDGEPLLNIPRFTPHDLRRTLRTHLSRLGVQPFVAEKCLNHSLGRIEQTYDKHTYIDERREALEKWANAVDLAVNERDNMVVMGSR